MGKSGRFLINYRYYKKLPECKAERAADTLDPGRHDFSGQVVEDGAEADAVAEGAGHDAGGRENAENLG